MKHDANIPQRDAALLDACRRGDTERALHLIAEGADIHCRDEARMSPMALACRAGAEDIVAEFLRRGISPNERADISSWEVFYYAAESGNIKLMRRLVQAGADPWISDWEDDTSLSTAHRLLAAGCPCCHISADREPQLRESAASPEALTWLDKHEAGLRRPVCSESTVERLYDAARLCAPAAGARIGPDAHRRRGLFDNGLPDFRTTG